MKRKVKIYWKNDDMKRCLSIIGLALCVLLDLQAQEVRVKRFTEVQEILMGKEQRRDNNGVICALVHVVVPESENVLFQGNVIGESAYKGNEYRVYLSEGSRYLRIHYPGCETLLVDFGAFGYEGLKSKRVYELVLNLPDELRYIMNGTLRVDSLSVRRTSEESIRQMKIIRDAVNKFGAQHIGPFMNGIAPVTKDGKVAFIDKEGSLLTAFAFDSCSNGNLKSHYFRKFWLVYKNELMGIIDSKGKLIADCKYRYISFRKNLAALSEKNEYYIWNKPKLNVINVETGELVAEKVNFDDAISLLFPSDGVPFVKNGKYFIYKGEKLFNQKFEKVYPFSEGLACVLTQKNEYVIIDRNGEQVGCLPHRMKPYVGKGQSPYPDGCFQEGLLPVEARNYPRDKNKGYVNALGKIMIPCKYDVAYPFSEGLAAVHIVKKYKRISNISLPSVTYWGYINQTGNIVFKHPDNLFFRCGEFKNGKAVGALNKNLLDSVSNISYTHLLYDVSGKIVMRGTASLNNLQQYHTDCFKYKLYPVEGICPDKSSILGYVNSDYELVIPHQFSVAEPFKDEFTSVTGEKGCGLLDSYGNVVWLNEEESENILEE